jgi:hypothetical protein
LHDFHARQSLLLFERFAGNEGGSLFERNVSTQEQNHEQDGNSQYDGPEGVARRMPAVQGWLREINFLGFTLIGFDGLH